MTCRSRSFQTGRREIRSDWRRVLDGSVLITMLRRLVDAEAHRACTRRGVLSRCNSGMRGQGWPLEWFGDPVSASPVVLTCHLPSTGRCLPSVCCICAYSSVLPRTTHPKPIRLKAVPGVPGLKGFMRSPKVDRDLQTSSAPGDASRLRDPQLRDRGLTEIQPPPDATTRYPFVTIDRARPTEEVWKARTRR
jgi:hypothetical protein